MNEEQFYQRLEHLKNLIEYNLRTDMDNAKNYNSYKTIIKLLEKYNFKNRLCLKGLISRTIIDSLELDYDLANKLMEFDRDIS